MEKDTIPIQGSQWFDCHTNTTHFVFKCPTCGRHREVVVDGRHLSADVRCSRCSGRKRVTAA